MDEKLNELLKDVEGQMGVYMDPLASAPYRVHFCEIAIRGQTTNGEATTIYATKARMRISVTSEPYSRFWSKLYARRSLR